MPRSIETLTALLLAGCSSSSPLIPSIFLINLWYGHTAPEYSTAQVDPAVVGAIGNIVGNAMLECRVGYVEFIRSLCLVIPPSFFRPHIITDFSSYFGICINPDGGSWLCSNNASSLASQVSVNQDPLNIIWVSDTF